MQNTLQEICVHAPLLLEALLLERLAAEHGTEPLLDLARERLAAAAAGVLRARGGPAVLVVRLARADTRRVAVRLHAGAALPAVRGARAEPGAVAPTELAVLVAIVVVVVAMVAGRLCAGQRR
jgi:hypothetical protein